MKVRRGFVSNSSSSSYVIAVDEPINTVGDLTKYIPPVNYAERVFNRNFPQTGIILCKPPQPECTSCKLKFSCYTDGNPDLIKSYLFWRCGDWDINEQREEEIISRDFGDCFNSFYEENKGKLAYFIRLPDMGEDGDMIDSDLRQSAYYVIEAPKMIID